MADKAWWGTTEIKSEAEAKGLEDQGFPIHRGAAPAKEKTSAKQDTGSKTADSGPKSADSGSK